MVLFGPLIRAARTINIPSDRSAWILTTRKNKESLEWTVMNAARRIRAARLILCVDSLNGMDDSRRVDIKRIFCKSVRENADFGFYASTIVFQIY